MKPKREKKKKHKTKTIIRNNLMPAAHKSSIKQHIHVSVCSCSVCMLMSEYVNSMFCFRCFWLLFAINLLHHVPLQCQNNTRNKVEYTSIAIVISTQCWKIRCYRNIQTEEIRRRTNKNKANNLVCEFEWSFFSLLSRLDAWIHVHAISEGKGLAMTLRAHFNVANEER